MRFQTDIDDLFAIGHAGCDLHIAVLVADAERHRHLCLCAVLQDVHVRAARVLDDGVLRKDERILVGLCIDVQVRRKPALDARVGGIERDLHKIIHDAALDRLRRIDIEHFALERLAEECVEGHV